MGACWAKLFACGCCDATPKLPSVKLNIVSSCCKTDRHNIIINHDDDIEQIKELIKTMNHNQSIKLRISKSNLRISNL